LTLERPAVNRERLPGLPGARGGRRVRDIRHRLLCRQCGRTEEVGCANDDQPCLTPVPAAGFTVDGAEVVFLGLCPACTAGPAGNGTAR
jgi:Fur family ferric uptake transcriptional regulator